MEKDRTIDILSFKKTYQQLWILEQILWTTPDNTYKKKLWFQLIRLKSKIFNEDLNVELLLSPDPQTRQRTRSDGGSV